jgi:hypothetical protein
MMQGPAQRIQHQAAARRNSEGGCCSEQEVTELTEGEEVVAFLGTRRASPVR